MAEPSSETHKRGVDELLWRPRRFSNDEVSTDSSCPSAVLVWNQQQHKIKRQKVDVIYDSKPQEDSDPGQAATDQREDDLSSLKVCTDKDGDKSITRKYSSDLSEDASTNRDSQQPVAIPRRWVLRRQSTHDSISSVLTELSASEAASALGAESSSSGRRHHHRRSSTPLATSQRSPPMDTLVRSMESWSLTHLRALRRNNLFDGTKRNSNDDGVDFRNAVRAARRDVMRTLRRTSSSGLGGDSNTTTLDGTSSSPRNKKEQSSASSSKMDEDAESFDALVGSRHPSFGSIRTL